MGFYGNITNTSRTQFQFDKTYPNRYTMDLSCGLDGVYAGRFVLVEYDSATYAEKQDVIVFQQFFCDDKTMYSGVNTAQINDVIIIQEFKTKVVGGATTTGNIVKDKTVARVPAYSRRFDANTDTLYVKVNAPAGDSYSYTWATENDFKKYKESREDNYDPVNLQQENQTYMINGLLYILSSYTESGTILPIKAGNCYSTNTVITYWIASVTLKEGVTSDSANSGQGENYSITWKEISANSSNNGDSISYYTTNYAIDTAWYGDSRGFDSTVWQKVYSSGSEKYVMVAELNTVVPTFAISADAPTMLPIVPHFDTDSTNVYYKVHWQPQWGVRIKAANSGLNGMQIDQNGNWISGASTLLTSDGTFYPSDQQTYWKRDYYSSSENKKIETYYNEANSLWMQQFILIKMVLILNLLVIVKIYLY
jgi:hypothetical protein